MRKRAPPSQLHYDAEEAQKYTERTRIVEIQRSIAERAIELLNFQAGERRLVLDIGAGSGLSGGACLSWSRRCVPGHITPHRCSIFVLRLQMCSQKPATSGLDWTSGASWCSTVLLPAATELTRYFAVRTCCKLRTSAVWTVI